MRHLEVTVLKGEEVFASGTFDVSDGDYEIVQGLLAEVDMTKPQAASLLAGYMHAREVGQVTEDMGKLALLASVYMLHAGETSIQIPLEQSAGQGGA